MSNDTLVMVGISALVVWSFIWKGIAMWKSAQKNQMAWFIAIFILNTAGILEIVYLLFFQKKSVELV